MWETGAYPVREDRTKTQSIGVASSKIRTKTQPIGVASSNPSSTTQLSCIILFMKSLLWTGSTFPLIQEGQLTCISNWRNSMHRYWLAA